MRAGHCASHVCGLGLVACSALCFAALTVLTQLAHRAGVSVATLVAARFALAAIVFWPLALALRRPLPSRRDALLALGLGTAYCADSALLFASLSHTKAALVDLLFFTYPALVAVGAVVLRRERWSGGRAAAIAATLLGTGLVIGGGADGLQLHGVSLALAAAVLYAGYALAAQTLLTRIDAVVLVALVTGSAAATAAAGGVALGQLHAPTGAHALALLAAIGLGATVVGIGTFLAGIARLGAARASITSSIQPALTALLAFLTFGDRLRPAQLAGGALVLVTIIILERRPARSARRPASALDAHEPIVVRLSRTTDRRALRKLAAAHAAELPTDALLVAEVGGQILAATALAAPGNALTHPVRSTTHLIELLELRASQLRHPDRRLPAKLTPSTATAI